MGRVHRRPAPSACAEGRRDGQPQPGRSGLPPPDVANGRRAPPAQRAEFAENRAVYLLMDPAERTAMVCGTPGNAAEQRDPEERILSYLAGHKELDASSGLPGDPADLGIKTVLDFCESIAWDTRLYGSRDLQTFGLTDDARVRLAPDFPEESVWRRVGGRRFGITEYELAELDEDLGFPKGTSRSVLERFSESGDVVKEGSCYRIVSQAA